MALSNYLIGKIEDAVFGAGSLGITSVTLRLMSTVPDADGAGGVEYSGAWTNYAALTKTTGGTNFPANAAGHIANGVDFTFSEATVTGGATVSIPGYAIFDQAGNQLFQGLFVNDQNAATPLVVINGVEVRLPASYWSFTMS